MSSRYLRIAVQSLLIMFVAEQTVILLHELAHGLTGVALGAEFPFFQLYPSGGRSIVIFPLDSPEWKNGAVLLAGYGMHLTASVFLLYLAVRKRASMDVRLVASLAGAVATINTLLGSGLTRPWAGGEVAQGLSALGLHPAARMAAETAWLIVELILAGVFLRRFLQSVDTGSTTRSYWGDLRLVAMAWGLPAVLLGSIEALVGAERGSISLAQHAPAMALFAGILLAMPMLLSGGIRAQTGCGLLKHQWLLAAFALIIAAGEFTAFGYNRQNPRGLFLNRHPREVTVAAFNVRIRFDPDAHARIQFVLRPFVLQHRFLWDRVSARQPDDWSCYESFARQSVLRLLPASSYRVIDRYSDPGARFYNAGHWESGARVIELEADLATRANGTQRMVPIVDFWRKQHAGFIDMLQFELPEGFAVAGVTEEPGNSRPPTLLSPRIVRWENPWMRGAFETSYVSIARLD